MVVTGPPAGHRQCRRLPVRASATCRTSSAALEHGGGTLAVLPDALAGHRLAGSAADRDAVRDALAKLGANPLLAGAFRDRRRTAA